MNKREIIKILQDREGFLEITEDENELDELYITEAKFKDIEVILKNLEDKTKKYESAKKKFIQKAQKLAKENCNIVVGNAFLANCHILDKDLVMLGESNILTNCIFIEGSNIIA